MRKGTEQRFSLTFFSSSEIGSNYHNDNDDTNEFVIPQVLADM